MNELDPQPYIDLQGRRTHRRGYRNFAGFRSYRFQPRDQFDKSAFEYPSPPISSYTIPNLQGVAE